jgi:mannose-6-phosphate isomerase-like protein (cupin superfamily)
MTDQNDNNPNEPYSEKRPWGEFERFTFNAPSTVKILEIEPGQSTSLQMHEKRDEYWHVISGDGILTIGDENLTAIPEKNYIVRKNTKHRIKAGVETLLILEISTGVFDEDDITRIEDDYGRVTT